MAVPSLITDLSTTAASNSPAGSENVFPNLDDYLRAQAAFLASVRDNSGNGWVSPYLPLAGGTMTGTVAGLQVSSLNGAGNPLAGLRNRVQNGAMMIDQRNAGAAQTITAAAALAYTVDRFYAYCTGANVTGQRVAGTAPNAYLYRFTGAASVTKIGFAQRIEDLNCQDMAGKTATLSVDLSNSLLTTVTWTAWRANTANTFGTLASPTRTLISTGTFTVTSTLTNYSTNITIPAAATTGIEIELSVGAQISGTWNIGDWQLEIGSLATPFEQISYGLSLALCQRFFQKPGAPMAGGIETTTVASFNYSYPVTMRVVPTFTAASTTADVRVSGSTTAGIAGTWVANAIGTEAAGFQFTRTAGTWTANIPAFLNQSTAIASLSAEL